MEVSTVLAVCMTILGCCFNVIFLEHIIRASSSSGNMIVFFQFLFISLEGFLFYSKFGMRKRVIPLRNYVVMVLMYFAVSVSNIMSLDCHIPMPLHMIFKSGSLVANLFLGAIILKRSYSISKYISVFLVSVGITICTIATSKMDNGASQTTSSYTSFSDSLIMLIGIFLLTFSLLMSARLGIYQETTFKKYGKQSREALWYNHFIPLPFFAFLAPGITNNIQVLNQSQPSPIPILSDVGLSLFNYDVTIPLLWQYMVANIVTQYICIRSIFYLTTVCTSLTVTLLITLRKFVSLGISVWYFQNSFSTLHWFGTGFVFVGTLLYSDIFKRTKCPPDGVKNATSNGYHSDNKKTN